MTLKHEKKNNQLEKTDFNSFIEIKKSDNNSGFCFGEIPSDNLTPNQIHQNKSGLRVKGQVILRGEKTSKVIIIPEDRYCYSTTELGINVKEDPNKVYSPSSASEISSSLKSLIGDVIRSVIGHAISQKKNNVKAGDLEVDTDDDTIVPESPTMVANEPIESFPPNLKSKKSSDNKLKDSFSKFTFCFGRPRVRFKEQVVTEKHEITMVAKLGGEINYPTSKLCKLEYAELDLNEAVLSRDDVLQNVSEINLFEASTIREDSKDWDLNRADVHCDNVLQRYYDIQFMKTATPIEDLKGIYSNKAAQHSVYGFQDDYDIQTMIIAASKEELQKIYSNKASQHIEIVRQLDRKTRPIKMAIEKEELQKLYLNKASQYNENELKMGKDMIFMETGTQYEEKQMYKVTNRDSEELDRNDSSEIEIDNSIPSDDLTMIIDVSTFAIINTTKVKSKKSGKGIKGKKKKPNNPNENSTKPKRKRDVREFKEEQKLSIKMIEQLTKIRKQQDAEMMNGDRLKFQKNIQLPNVDILPITNHDKFEINEMPLIKNVNLNLGYQIRKVEFNDVKAANVNEIGSKLHPDVVYQKHESNFRERPTLMDFNDPVLSMFDDNDPKKSILKYKNTSNNISHSKTFQLFPDKQSKFSNELPKTTTGVFYTENKQRIDYINSKIKSSKESLLDYNTSMLHFDASNENFTTNNCREHFTGYVAGRRHMGHCCYRSQMSDYSYRVFRNNCFNICKLDLNHPYEFLLCICYTNLSERRPLQLPCNQPVCSDATLLRIRPPNCKANITNFTFPFEINIELENIDGDLEQKRLFEEMCPQWKNVENINETIDNNLVEFKANEHFVSNQSPYANTPVNSIPNFSAIQKSNIHTINGTERYETDKTTLKIQNEPMIYSELQCSTKFHSAHSNQLSDKEDEKDRHSSKKSHSDYPDQILDKVDPNDHYHSTKFYSNHPDQLSDTEDPNDRQRSTKVYLNHLEQLSDREDSNDKQRSTRFYSFHPDKILDKEDHNDGRLASTFSSDYPDQLSDTEDPNNKHRSTKVYYVLPVKISDEEDHNDGRPASKFYSDNPDPFSANEDPNDRHRSTKFYSVHPDKISDKEDHNDGRPASKFYSDNPVQLSDKEDNNDRHRSTKFYSVHPDKISDTEDHNDGHPSNRFYSDHLDQLSDKEDPNDRHRSTKFYSVHPDQVASNVYHNDRHRSTKFYSIHPDQISDKTEENDKDKNEISDKEGLSEHFQRDTKYYSVHKTTTTFKEHLNLKVNSSEYIDGKNISSIDSNAKVEGQNYDGKSYESTWNKKSILPNVNTDDQSKNIDHMIINSKLNENYQPNDLKEEAFSFDSDYKPDQLGVFSINSRDSQISIDTNDMGVKNPYSARTSIKNDSSKRALSNMNKISHRNKTLTKPQIDSFLNETVIDTDEIQYFIAGSKDDDQYDSDSKEKDRSNNNRFMIMNCNDKYDSDNIIGIKESKSVNINHLIEKKIKCFFQVDMVKIK